MKIKKIKNKKITNKLFLSIDNIEEQVLIFENCYFNDLQLSKSFKKDMKKVIFKNCKILNANIEKIDEIELNCCTIGQILINNSKNIDLNNIYYDDLDKNIIDIVGKNVNNVKMYRVHSQVNINNSKNVFLNNSYISINNISSNTVVLDSSLISSKFKKLGYIKSDYIITNNDSEIQKCILETDYIRINDNSELNLDSSYIDISKILEIGKNSQINDYYNNSIFNSDDILLKPNANIGIKGLNYENKNSYVETMMFNLLQEYRTKVAKTLKLVENKYNKPIKDLRG